MKVSALGLLIVVALSGSGCVRGERGPLLAGGREVKSRLADLRNPDARIRRQAVLKLGNVGDDDPAVPEALFQALYDADVLVRRDAVVAVMKLRSPGEEIIAQLGTMSRSDRDTGVRDYARRALARLGHH
jgi:hypothetical protein